jgi:ADP-ribose pyrophosphatase
MSDKKIRISSREPLYAGHFRLDRYRFRHRRHDGRWSKELSREVFDRGNAVALLLYDPKRDAVVLTEQLRLPADIAGFPGWQIETVAGLVDQDGESEQDVARREALEEAGTAIGGELIFAHRLLTSPGGSTEAVTIFCAQVDARRAGGIYGLASEGEDIKVTVLPFARAMRMLREGEIGNMTGAVALYWLAANRARLKRRWLHPRRKPKLAAKSSRA